MLSRFAPANHQGLVFGAKFVVSFGAGPVGLYLITQVRHSTGEFTDLLLAYSVLAVLVTMVALLLPRLPDEETPVAPKMTPAAAE